MAALAGEPWRGATDIQLNGAASNRRAWATLRTIGDPAPGEPTADRATWEGNPGASFTVRVEWSSSGAPLDGQFTSIEVKTFLPGTGTQVGATWTIAVAADSGSSERTFHLDDDPLSNAAGTSQSGMVEIYLKVIRNVAVAYDADSRGVKAGVNAATTHNWARGYARARVLLSAFSLSNAAPGGAEPASFAYPDSTFHRATLTATLYRSVTLELEHRKASDGTLLRSEVGASGTGTTRDYSWTAATGATAKVLADYPSALAVNLHAKTQDLSFGGTASKEYAWAAAGHLTGWAQVDDLTLQAASRFTSDPRVTLEAMTRTSALTVVNFGYHTLDGTFEVKNARLEKLNSTDHGLYSHAVVRSKDVAAGTLQKTISSDLTPSAAGLFTLPSYTYSGPVSTVSRGTGTDSDTAAHDQTGRTKTLFAEVGGPAGVGSSQRPTATGSGTFVALSDLLRLDSHPQKTSALAKDSDPLASPGSGEVANYVISADSLFGFAFVGDVQGTGRSGVDVTLSLLDPDGAQSGSSAVKATQSAPDRGWTTSAGSFSVLAPAGEWELRVLVELTAAGASGNYGDLGVLPFGSLDQVVNFNSAYTADRALAITLPDEVPVGRAATITVEYLQSGTRLTLDAAPSIRIYSLSGAGAQSQELALTTMSQYSGQQAWSAAWTPSAEGTYLVEVRAEYLASGIQGAERVSARPQFDPIALAVGDLLVSRM